VAAQSTNLAARKTAAATKGAFVEVLGRLVRVEGRLIRIARLDAEKYHFLDDPAPFVAALRGSAPRIDLFTFLQRPPERSPKFTYAMEWDNLAILPLSSFDQWWNSQIDNKTRNMIRKAERKGIVVREVAFDESLVRGIWEVYNESPIRQGKPSTHFGKTLRQVHAEEATYLEDSVFLGAFYENQIVGFIKMVLDETRMQAGLMNIVSMVSHRDKAPTNALVAQAVRSCVDRKIRFLVYSNFSYGKKQRDSLADFKQNNGFQRFDLPRYYVPLTPLGAGALELGLHRRLVEMIPEPLAEKLRGLKKKWYMRKHRVALEGGGE
jgi:hypothetical protein